MSDYWVKPTLDQLKAELEWERQQEIVRRKRRKLVSVIAVAIAVILIGGTQLIPRTVSTGYAAETLAEQETVETEAEAPEMDNAVVSGK